MVLARTFLVRLSTPRALLTASAATPRPRRVVEPVDAPADCIKKAAHRAGHDADSVPEQSIVGGMMNIGLHHRGISPELLAIFQFHFNSRLNDQIVDDFECLRCQAVEGLIERLMLRYWPAVEISELAKRDSVGDPLTQLTQVPVLYPLENQ